MDDFTRSYLKTCLWAETDGSDDTGWSPFDETYSIDDFAPVAIAQAVRECAEFQAANAIDLSAVPESPDGSSPESYAGYLFWLSRNGHGAGFWDRDLGDAGDRLQEASRRAGERYCYAGDDGLLYF